MSKDLADLIVELEEDEALRVVQERLESGEDSFKILSDARKALETVGRLFEEGEYFIPHLIYSGEIMSQIGNMLRPKMKAGSEAEKEEKVGTVVIGTVAGDIHDLGKNMVSFMLEVNGFEVVDLGVDVPKDKFVQTVRDVQPDILGLSGLLTSVFKSMKEVEEAIESAGLRQSVKIIIGGGQVDERVSQFTKADAFAVDAGSGVRQCLAWMGGKKL